MARMAIHPISLSAGLVIIGLSETLLGLVPHHIDDAEGERQQHTQNPSEIPHAKALSVIEGPGRLAS